MLKGRATPPTLLEYVMPERKHALHREFQKHKNFDGQV